MLTPYKYGSSDRIQPKKHTELPGLSSVNRDLQITNIRMRITDTHLETNEPFVQNGKELGMRKYQTTHIPVYLFDEEILASQADICRMSLIAIEPVLSDYAAKTGNPDLDKYLSIHLTILGLFITKNDFKGIMRAAIAYDLNIHFIHLSRAQIVELSDDVWENQRHNLFRTQSLEDSYGPIMSYTFTLLILVAKRPDYRSSEWFSAKFISFHPLFNKMMKADMRPPSRATIVAYNTAMSSRKLIKTAVLEVMRGIALTESRYSEVFRALFDFITKKDPECCG